MNALNLAQRAYANPATPTRTDRGIEYDALARVTRGLKVAQQAAARPSATPGLASMARALHENLQLWAILAADVAQPDNGLPATLRARLFYLYEFTAQHSRKVLTGEAAAGVLIDINTAVMRGLRHEGAEG